LRYGNIQKAWNFVEAHLKVAIENYGKTVEHLQRLMINRRRCRMEKEKKMELTEGRVYKITSLGSRDHLLELKELLKDLSLSGWTKLVF